MMISSILKSSTHQSKKTNINTRWRYLSSLPTRSDYMHFEQRQTRFADTDLFGHINNSIYYQYMDDSVNSPLLKKGYGADYPRFVVENGMKYYKPIEYPMTVDVGLRVSTLSEKSVTYDVGMFTEKYGDAICARGKFVHVYVDIRTGKPIPIHQDVRSALEELLVKD